VVKGNAILSSKGLLGDGTARDRGVQHGLFSRGKLVVKRMDREDAKGDADETSKREGTRGGEERR